MGLGQFVLAVARPPANFDGASWHGLHRTPNQQFDRETMTLGNRIFDRQSGAVLLNGTAPLDPVNLPPL